MSKKKKKEKKESAEYKMKTAVTTKTHYTSAAYCESPKICGFQHRFVCCDLWLQMWHCLGNIFYTLIKKQLMQYFRRRGKKGLILRKTFWLFCIVLEDFNVCRH